LVTFYSLLSLFDQDVSRFVHGVIYHFSAELAKTEIHGNRTDGDIAKLRYLD
jgi:hypothetical protein